MWAKQRYLKIPLFSVFADAEECFWFGYILLKPFLFSKEKLLWQSLTHEFRGKYLISGRSELDWVLKLGA